VPPYSIHVYTNMALGWVLTNYVALLWVQVGQPWSRLFVSVGLPTFNNSVAALQTRVPAIMKTSRMCDARGVLSHVPYHRPHRLNNKNKNLHNFRNAWIWFSVERSVSCLVNTQKISGFHIFKVQSLWWCSTRACVKFYLIFWRLKYSVYSYKMV
jgi:hypothetical protein